MTHIYTWGNNPKRAALKGRPCRIVASGALRSVLVEFADGEKVVTDLWALREKKEAEPKLRLF